MFSEGNSELRGLATGAAIGMGLIGLVLLLACFNVATLLLARAVERERDMGIRAALGAGRARLMRLVLTEGFVIAGLAAVLAVVIASGTQSIIGSFAIPIEQPQHIDLSTDWRVIGFIVALACVAGVLPGLWPAVAPGAWTCCKSSIAGCERGRRTAFAPPPMAGRRADRGLDGVPGHRGALDSSVGYLADTDYGFDHRHLIIADVDPGASGLDEDGARRYVDALVARASTLPGVTGAAVADHAPFFIGFDRLTPVWPAGVPCDGDACPKIATLAAGPGYFKTMGISMAAGREFDGAGASSDVIVNQAFARQQWPDERGLGETLRLGPQETRDGGWNHEQAPHARPRSGAAHSDVPIADEHYEDALTVVARTAADPAPAVRAFVEAAHAIDSSVSLVSVKTMSQRMAVQLWPFNTMRRVFGSAAAGAAARDGGTVECRDSFGQPAAEGVRRARVDRRLASRSDGRGAGRQPAAPRAWPGRWPCTPVAAARLAQVVFIGVNVLNPTTYLAVALVECAIVLVAHRPGAARRKTVVAIALFAVGLAATPAQGATITGTVTAQVGSAAIPGVTVQLYTSAGVVLSTTITDGSGAYSFNVPAGTYYVKTFADQSPPNNIYMDELFMPFFSSLPCVPCDVTTGLPITVGPTTVFNGVDFALEIGGGFSGTVRDAGTMAPINGLNLDVYDRFGMFAKSFGIFSAGTYSIQGLIPGVRYYARTRSSLNYADRLYNQLPCSPCYPPFGTPIVVSAGSTLAGINFNLSPGGTVTGTVTNAAMSPLSGVTVQLFSFTGGGPVRTGITNGSGGFSFTGLPTAFYVARTFVTPTQNYIDEIFNNRVAAGDSLTNGTGILITAGQATSNVNFALDAGGSITGTVTNAQTMAPVGGISVEVVTQRGASVKTVTTDGSGTYALNGLPNGSYFVRTTNSASYADELYDNFPFLTGDLTTGTSVVVSTAAITPNINFALEPGGSITGTVTSVGASGLTGIGIRLYDSLGRQVKTTVTGASGLYSFTGLPTGTYYARTTNTSGYMNVLYGTVPCLHVCNPLTGTGIAVATGGVTSSDQLCAHGRRSDLRDGHRRCSRHGCQGPRLLRGQRARRRIPADRQQRLLHHRRRVARGHVLRPHRQHRRSARQALQRPHPVLAELSCAVGYRHRGHAGQHHAQHRLRDGRRHRDAAER